MFGGGSSDTRFAGEIDNLLSRVTEIYHEVRSRRARDAALSGAAR